MQLAKAAFTCLGFSLATSSLPAVPENYAAKSLRSPKLNLQAEAKPKFLNNLLEAGANIEEIRSDFIDGKLKLSKEVEAYVDQSLKDYCGIDLSTCKDPSAKYVIRAFYMATEAIEVNLTLGVSDQKLQNLIEFATDIAILAPQNMIANFDYRDDIRKALIEISRQMFSAGSPDRDLTQVNPDSLAAYRTIGPMLMAVRQVASQELPETWEHGKAWGRRSSFNNGIALGVFGTLCSFWLVKSLNQLNKRKS